MLRDIDAVPITDFSEFLNEVPSKLAGGAAVHRYSIAQISASTGR
jgi:hypothetical protein